MSTEDQNYFNELFPEVFCISTIAELNSWTPVQAIASAARIIENRCIEDDDPQSLFMIRIDDRLGFESILLTLLVWLTKGYEAPKNKVEMSRFLDLEIKSKTIETIKNLKFNPVISIKKTTDLNGVVNKYFVIQDKAEMIELVAFPLKALIDILFMGFDSAWSGYQLKKKSQEQTGSSPTIYHSPYADSRLFSVIQALCFAVLGMEVTVNYGNGKMQIVNDYRSINLQVTPPLNKRFIKSAGQLFEGGKK